MRSHPFLVILTWCKLAPHGPHFGPDHDAWIEHLHRAAAMQPHRAVGVSPYNAPLLTEACRGKQPSISVHVMAGSADSHPGPEPGTRQLPTAPATVLMYRPGSAAVTLCGCNIHRGDPLSHGCRPDGPAPVKGKAHRFLPCLWSLIRRMF